MRRRRGSHWALLACGFLAASSAVAVAQTIPEGYREGTHIVREGDTLRAITKTYLGSEDLWEKNWELNPQVENPDLLFPLQRLRIILAPQIARPTARLVTIAGEVEGKPAPSDWNRSLEDDLMLERDGVRANENSSTVLEFSDGSELTLKDDSTIFLRVAGRSLRGGEERSVEILEGQADLASAALAPETDIEIVVGGATAIPKAGESGAVEARGRRVSEGGARFMVFEGEGEVEAAGEKVVLTAGTGSAVPPAGPPAPPEALLPAVAGLAPASGGRYELERTRFSWSPVEGAASYTLEVCRDVDCGDLVMLEDGIEGTGWEVTDLPLGALAWRVTAVSGSGLDGYPSASQTIEVLANRMDYDPPVAEFVVSGRSSVAGDVTYYAGDLDVRLEASDAGTGVEMVTLMLDGNEVDAEALRGPWKSGDYQLSATVSDASGNTTSVGPLDMHVDADPPALSWTVGGEELLADQFGGSAPAGWSKQNSRSARRELKDFGRGRPFPKWTVLSWKSSLPSAGGRFTPDAVSRQRSHDWFSLERRDAEVVVFAPALLVTGESERLNDRLLAISSTDERSGQEMLRIWRRPGPDARHWLQVEAVDQLGNRTVERWPFPLTD